MTGYRKYLKKCNLRLYPCQNDQLKTKENIKIYVTKGDLLTSVLFKVVENLAINVLLRTAFIYEHMVAILPGVRRVAVRKSTPVSILKQCDLSANAGFTKRNEQDESLKTHFETKGNQDLTIKQSNLV